MKRHQYGKKKCYSHTKYKKARFSEMLSLLLLMGKPGLMENDGELAWWRGKPHRRRFPLKDPSSSPCGEVKW